MEVDHSDLWVMLISTIRYSMGRRTYMTSLAPELVLKYQDALEYYQLKQISEEIYRELELYEKAKKTMGAKFDHEGWKTFAKKIHEAAVQKTPIEPIPDLGKV